MADTKKVAVAASAGFALACTCIAAFEGFQPVGHHDPIDPPGVNTICYGHIEDVKIGQKADKAECTAMLTNDLTEKYAPQVAAAIHVPMPPHRYAAMLSFDYNVGGSALLHSTVARKLNAGDVKGGCAALLMWTHANGKFVQGLLNRRKQEEAWCLRND